MPYFQGQIVTVHVALLKRGVLFFPAFVYNSTFSFRKLIVVIPIRSCGQVICMTSTVALLQTLLPSILLLLLFFGLSEFKISSQELHYQTWLAQ